MNSRNAPPAAGSLGVTALAWDKEEIGRWARKLEDFFESSFARSFDSKKAAAFAVAHAQPHFLGLCARYSTAAVTAGFGVKESKIAPLLGTSGASAHFVKFLTRRLLLANVTTPNYAKDYGTHVLVPLGFSATAVLSADAKRDEIEVPEDYEAATGDVIIFPANDEADNEAGHMQICTGNSDPEKQWISDARQKTILPNKNLALGWQKVGFVVYRFAIMNLFYKPIVHH